MCTSTQNKLYNVLTGVAFVTGLGAPIAAFAGLGLHNYGHEDASEKAFQAAKGLLYTYVAATGTAILFTASRTVYEGIKDGCERASQVFRESFKSDGLIRDTFMAPILPILACLSSSSADSSNV